MTETEGVNNGSQSNTSMPLGDVGLLDGSGHNQHDTIGFTAAGPVVESDNPAPRRLRELLHHVAPRDDTLHQIKDFLSRPTQVWRGDIVYSNSGAGKIEMELGVMETLYQDSNFRAMREKLSGFYGFTATACVKVVVNSQPMIGGVLNLFYAPHYNYASRATAFYPIRMDTASDENRLPFTTGLPCRIFNVAKETEVVLKAAYVGPNVFINLAEKQTAFGAFFLQSVCPVWGPTNSSSLDVTMYMYFEDVQVYGAIRPFYQGPDIVSLPSVSEKAEAKGKVKTAKPKKKGLAKLLSSIPLLEDVAPDVSMEDVQAAIGIAAMFGFSKPNNEAKHERMAQTPFGQPQNTDGNSNAFKLSTSSTNNLTQIPMGLTDEDEMAIAHIVKQPQYLTTFQWRAGHKQTDELIAIPVNPNCHLWEGGAYYPTRLRYVADMFRYWRGGLKYTFHVAGTKFHSGRIRLIYDLDSDKTPTVTENYNYHYGQIVDIRDGLTFSVTCPYFSSAPWREVPYSKRDEVWRDWFVTTYDGDSSKSNENALYVFVENALKAPDTAAQSINIAVFVSAMEDFELAGPTIGSNSFYNNGGLTGISTLSEEEETSIKEQQTRAPIPSKRQMAEYQGPDPNVFSEDIRNISMIDSLDHEVSVHLAASEICMGEKITSLRQLLKRYQLVGNFNTQHTNGERRTEVICPYEITYSGPDDYRWDFTFHGRIQQLYRFYRGGMRFLLTTPGETTDWNVHYTLEDQDYDLFPIDHPYGPHAPIYGLMNQQGSYFDWSYMINHPTTLDLPNIGNLQGGLDIQFPYYCRYPFCLNDEHPKSESPQSYMRGSITGEKPAGVAFVGCKNVNSDVNIYRACADDFSNGFLLGAPVCRYNISYAARGTH